MKKQSNILLLIAVFLQIGSYFMPFLSEGSGWKFFGLGVDAFFREGVQQSNWHAFYAFFSPLLSLPILWVGMSKYVIGVKLSWLKVLLFFFLFCPVLLSLGLVFARQDNFGGGELLGYFVWMLSLFLMYILFFFNRKQYLEDSNGDLMNHLIEEE